MYFSDGRHKGLRDNSTGAVFSRGVSILQSRCFRPSGVSVVPSFPLPALADNSLACPPMAQATRAPVLISTTSRIRVAATISAPAASFCPRLFSTAAAPQVPTEAPTAAPRPASSFPSSSSCVSTTAVVSESKKSIVVYSPATVVDLTSPTPAAIPADIPQALVAHVSAELMHAEASGNPLEFKDVKRTLQDGMYNNFLKPHGWKYKNASNTRSGFDFYFHEGVYFSSDDPVPGDYATKTITQHLLDELRVILPQIPPEPTVATKRVVDYRKAARGVRRTGG